MKLKKERLHERLLVIEKIKKQIIELREKNILTDNLKTEGEKKKKDETAEKKRLLREWLAKRNELNLQVEQKNAAKKSTAKKIKKTKKPRYKFR